MSKNKDYNVIFESPPLNRVGAPSGNINAKKQKTDDVVTKKQKRSGNSKEYLIGRLKRDAPLHFDLLKSGAYKSVHEAAKTAGIIKKKTRIERITSQLEKLSLTELDLASQVIQQRVDAIQHSFSAYNAVKIWHKKVHQKGENNLYVFMAKSYTPKAYISNNNKLLDFNKKYHSGDKQTSEHSVEALKLLGKAIGNEALREEYENYASKYGIPIISKWYRIFYKNFDNYYNGLNLSNLRVRESSISHGTLHRTRDFINAIQNHFDPPT